MRFVRRNDPGGDWPDVDDKPLLECVDKWLLPFTPERPGRDFLSGMDICAALSSLLSYERQRELERLAPERLKVPTGTSVRIDYSGERPVLAVRLQELFGCAETPALMGGRVRVLLHLLSPARRPLQITDDLAGFWTGSYKLVKAEMKGRYPRHYWPDNPLEAEPTTRAKKRHD
jgi:ATP-dependent helicase HrpB